MLRSQRFDTHAGAQVPVIHLGVIAIVGSRRLDHQRLGRDRIEVGAKVHRALDRDDAL